MLANFAIVLWQNTLLLHLTVEQRGKKILMISPKKKAKVISDNARSKTDVGSPEVQAAVLTERISEVTSHLKTHKKDKMSRRGLLQMVGKRRRLLRYLAIKQPNKHEKVIAKLGLRK